MSTSNLLTFGVTSDTVNSWLNPQYDVGLPWIGPGYTGTYAGYNGYILQTDNIAWFPGQWNSWYVSVGNNLYQITSTASGNNLQINDPEAALSGTSGTFTIVKPYSMSTAQFKTFLTRTIGEIKSRVPVRYKELLNGHVHGEMIVFNAEHEQRYAQTAYAVDSTPLPTAVNTVDTLSSISNPETFPNFYQWRNYQWDYYERFRNNYSQGVLFIPSAYRYNAYLVRPMDKFTSIYQFCDYDLENNQDESGNLSTTIVYHIMGYDQNINTQNNTSPWALLRNDNVMADYSTLFPNENDIPAIIQNLVIYRLLYWTWTLTTGYQTEMPKYIQSYQDEYNKTLDDIREGRQGIPEFDQIRFYGDQHFQVGGSRYGSAQRARA